MRSSPSCLNTKHVLRLRNHSPGAIIKAINTSEQKVAEALLEKSDMRFRLKYILGELNRQEDEEDPYAYDENETPTIEEHADLIVSSEEKAHQQALLKEYVQRIIQLAEKHKRAFEQTSGPLKEITSEDRNAALDTIEEQATASNELLAITSDILDEIRSKFGYIRDGKFERTTTGWPKAWTLKSPVTEREAFLKSTRFFPVLRCNPGVNY